MAKLNGVKTLDMVNGEITKVAYGGAEYVKTEGLPKMGDLVRAEEGRYDITYGAFYRITEDADHEDDVDDGRVRDAEDYVLFRKVAASANPSVEERVAKAEGEIESLKSDVAALKGEPEYKRIDRSEARAGDFVKFDDPPSYLTDKEYYEIKEFAQGDPVIIDDDGDEYDTYSDEFEVYRKVSAASVEAEPKPERLKVGDYAKVVNDSRDHEVEIGTIVLVTIIDDAAPSIKCDDLSGNRIGWFFERELVRATDEEVAEAKDEAARAKFKRGDKVRLLSGGGDYPLGGFTDGNIYEVSDNAYNHQRGTLIRIEGGNCFRGSGFATPDQLEILSEEEAAEIERKQAEEAKWAEIGRKVGEYKEGDVVRYDYGDNEICEVVDDTEDGRVRVQTKEYGICREKPANLRLITPVEARFDR
ncbi:hypothetical protein [Bacillus velezensis]|uniref:hypothetical protein n=1 Tax=Bacillus velezensis TaxID=492670 RepID=UPI0009F3FFCA|nr:hypothetical protein [Bacillus velezensis]OQV53354.1 hypothetical protein B5Z20_03300 [Bacillus velezensis]OQV55377.1 hypothetical protein B5Z22_08165 [Bacillus velezensis]OQV60868.1 hypothetical protein B5Z24_08170 [Bacillus velezensis]OQV61935.1 hypothetical protein B5Z23_08155 [Bacillus velezensis]